MVFDFSLAISGSVAVSSQQLQIACQAGCNGAMPSAVWPGDAGGSCQAAVQHSLHHNQHSALILVDVLVLWGCRQAGSSNPPSSYTSIRAGA
jgi:hypothetical protein